MSDNPYGWRHFVARCSPYFELMRVHKPAGIVYIYLPYLYGSMLAFSVQNPTPSLRSVAATSLLLIFIGFLIRSIGCTWNDIVDREFDAAVARCSNRPLARGAIRVEAAYVALAIQYVVLFLVMSATTQKACIIYLVPVISSGTLYPYAKRYTHYAQLVLGISLSLGVFLGSAIAGVDPITLGVSNHGRSMLYCAASYVCWTMVYDTIYACQDREEDKMLGLKTMAISLERRLRPVLRTLSVTQLGLLLATGYLFEAGLVYLVGILCAAVMVCLMVELVDLDDPRSCWRWFKHGSLLVGGSVGIAFCGEYGARVLRTMN